VPRAELPKYLMACQISMFFILNTYSKKASSPTKHAELMGLGIPVIANAGVGDTEKIISESGTGLIVDLSAKPDPEKIYAQIDQLLKLDRAFIRNIGKNIFSLDIGVERYRSIYSKLISKAHKK
jgi:glycosyltransferase involved in cell wall biosynthesis